MAKAAHAAVQSVPILSFPVSSCTPVSKPDNIHCSSTTGPKASQQVPSYCSAIGNHHNPPGFQAAPTHSQPINYNHHFITRKCTQAAHSRAADSGREQQPTHSSKVCKSIPGSADEGSTTPAIFQAEGELVDGWVSGHCNQLHHQTASTQAKHLTSNISSPLCSYPCRG